MSWGTCYKNENNVYKSFPGIMEDSRLFTDYNSNAVLNKSMRDLNKIKSNEDYRKYLTNNAQSIINQNLETATFENNCNVMMKLDSENKNHPHLYHTTLDKKNPIGYEESNLKNMYLSRQELNIKKMSPYH
jgi:hypothetical protein